MNLLPMIAACIPMALLGQLAARHHADRHLCYLAAAALLYMAMSRGFYWNLFGRGHGWWTANRISALLTFAAMAGVPTLIANRRL